MASLGSSWRNKWPWMFAAAEPTFTNSRNFGAKTQKRIYQRFRDFNVIKGSHVMVANIHKIYRSRDKAIDVRNNLVALFLIDFIHQQPQRSSSGKPS